MNGRRRVAAGWSTINAASGAVLLVLSGCAGAGDPAQPPALAYGEPDPNPATYTFSDTASFEIQAPGYGVMEVETAHTGTAELRFQEGAGGYDVQVRFPELDGSFRSAGQGEERITASDVGGPIGVDLSFRGVVAVVDTPAVTAAFEEVVGVEALVRPLFVRLPGYAVRAGARWVDTVVTREESGGTASTGTSVIVSTLLGDTLVNGRRLLRIGTHTETSLEVVGTSGVRRSRSSSREPWKAASSGTPRPACSSPARRAVSSPGPSCFRAQALPRCPSRHASDAPWHCGPEAGRRYSRSWRTMRTARMMPASAAATKRSRARAG